MSFYTFSIIIANCGMLVDLWVNGYNTCVCNVMKGNRGSVDSFKYETNVVSYESWYWLRMLVLTLMTYIELMVQWIVLVSTYINSLKLYVYLWNHLYVLWTWKQLIFLVESEIWFAEVCLIVDLSNVEFTQLFNKWMWFPIGF